MYFELAEQALVLVDGVLQAARESDVSLSANQSGSMFTWFFQPGPVVDWDTASKSDTQAFAAFHRGMLERGIYLPPSQYEAAFLSTAHTEEDVAKTVDAAREVFKIG